MNDFPKTNLGVLEGKRDSDFIAGILPYQVVLPNYDWRPHCPDGEPQFSNKADCMGCVSFSNNNSAEVQLKQQGLSYNFSDRWLAKTSGTTPDGNYLYKVADVGRNIGRVLEADYPPPTDWTWDTYYSEIPASVNSKVIQFDEAYEWIPTDATSLIYHLKQAPIQITIPAPHPNHAVLLVYVDGNTAYYYDSYPPYLKTMDVSLISSALKILVKPKFMNKAKVIKSKTSPTVYICYPVPDMDFLNKNADLQGISVPNPIPNSDTL